MITAEQVVKRNRQHRQHGLVTGRPRVRREDWHRLSEGWAKQPGRRFGPQPWGPDEPKKNKVTDPDGNARIFPLTADQRITRYAKTNHFRRPAQPNPGDLPEDDEHDARRHAALLGLTMRQRRRLVHKANHATAPFGKRAES